MLSLTLTLALIADMNINAQLPTTAELARYRSCLLSKQTTQVQLWERMRLDQYDFSGGFFTTGLPPDSHTVIYLSKNGTHSLTIKMVSSVGGDAWVLDSVKID